MNEHEADRQAAAIVMRVFGSISDEASPIGRIARTSELREDDPASVESVHAWRDVRRQLKWAISCALLGVRFPYPKDRTSVHYDGGVKVITLGTEHGFADVEVPAS